METLASSEWRRNHSLGRPVAADDVYAAFDLYQEALQVTGHSQLADALQERVTLQLCKEFGAVLYVLKGLARPPGYQLPTFPRQQTWEDILLEEPLEGEHWDEPQWSGSDCTMDTDSGELEQVSEGSRSGSGPGSERDPESRLDKGRQLPVPAHELQVPMLPRALLPPQLAQELVKSLLGYTPHCPNAPQSIRTEFGHLQSIVAALREFSNHEEAGSYFLSAFLDLQATLLSLKPATLLAALATVKPLILPYRYLLSLSPNYNDMLDQLVGRGCFAAVSSPLKSHLNLWINQGTLGPILSLCEPTLEQVFGDDFDFELPRFLRRQTCVDAGRYAWLSLHLGRAVRELDISLDNLQLAAVAEIRLKELLVHLRPLLLEAWETLSGVYFAQDARALEFLQDWSYNGLSSALLRTTLRFDPEMNPQIEVPPLASLILPVGELTRFWQSLLKAYGSEPAQLLEMQLFAIEATRSVRAQIEGLASVNKLVLRKYK